MAKKFIRTNKSIFDAIPDKSLYLDSIVFIEDTKEIWTNGNYYGRNDNEDSNILYDLETGLDLNGDEVKTVNKLIIDHNGLVYSNNDLVINNIKVNNTIIEKDDNGAVEIPVGDLNVLSDWNEEDETSDAYIKNKPSIPDEVTESTVSGWGFTKNTGTYSKPSEGIPKSDLANTVQASLNKADTALQSYTELYTGTVTEIKMNNTSKGTSGIVDLGTVVTNAVISQTATDASITDGVLTIPALMGKDGEKGDDGISATHSWDGTTLTITSASGTSSADLKGEKGNLGILGEKGEDGLNGAFVTEYSAGVLNTTSDLENSYYNTEFINVSEIVLEIEPNKYYCWSEPVSTLTITLKEPLNTNILNIYSFEFTTSDSGCTLILPQNVKWMGGEAPEVESSMTYQISITNNLAIIQGFTYAQ